MLQDSLPLHVRVARAAAMYAWARQLIGREIVARTGPLSAARLKWETAPLARGLDSFITAAEEVGFLLDAESVRRGVADGSMFQLFDMAEALKIDLYPRELVPGELGRSRFSRACHCAGAHQGSRVWAVLLRSTQPFAAHVASSADFSRVRAASYQGSTKPGSCCGG